MPTPTGWGSRSRWQRRFAAFALTLFPLLVAGGILAPDVVSMVAETVVEQGAASGEEPVFDPASRPQDKPPLLLAPREFTGASPPELIDLQRLFSRTPFDDPLVRQFSRLMTFPRSHGDMIVLDDTDQQQKDIDFKDPVMVGAVTGDPWDPPSPDLLPISGSPRPFGDGLRFDDPIATGEGNIDPVPEPSTGLMLGAALGGLSLYRRARRRAQRQPSTS